MNNLFDSPQFGIVITIFVYYFSKKLYDKYKSPFLYPLLTASAFIIIFLLLTGISFESYNTGGSMISYILGPVTVILAVPLYRQKKYLKKYFLPITFGALIGSIFSIVLIYYMSIFFGLSNEVTLSILSKSVTAPIAKGISEQTGGVPAITVFTVILTGFIGPILAPYVIKVFRLRNKIAQGIGLGTSSHGGGTAKALELGDLQGAMSGLAMGLAGVITAIAIPVFLKLIQG